MAGAASARASPRRRRPGRQAMSDLQTPTSPGRSRVDIYVVMGRRIKSCWFNATDPLLPNHVYRADVSPGGGKVTITVHQRADLGRAGLLDLCDRLQAARLRDGDHHRESQDAARPRRQDAIRHRPLAARRVRLQQENAGGRVGAGRSPASEADEATADAVAGLDRGAAPLTDPSRHAVAIRGPIDLVGSSLTRASSRQSTNAAADGSAGSGAAGRGADAEAE